MGMPRPPRLLLAALCLFTGALLHGSPAVDPPGAGGGAVDWSGFEIVTEDLPPLAYLDAGGRLRGESAEWVGRALLRLGLGRSIAVYPWARILESLETRPSFFAFNLARTAEREGRFVWVYRTATKKVGAFALRSRRDIRVEGLEDLRRYSLVVLNRNVAHLELLARGFGAASGKGLTALSSEKAIIPFLFMGRAEVWVRTYLAEGDLDEQIRAAGYDPRQLRLVSELEGLEVDLYLAANPSTPPAQVEALRAAMAETAPASLP